MSEILNERQKYRIEKPVGACDYARKGARNSEDLKSYTGDVVKEFWCDTLFREHKYFVRVEYDTSTHAMQSSYDGMPPEKAVRYFQTTDFPTPGLQIPEVIKCGKWSDPSKINTWRDEFEQTHRVGEWGIYAENYEQYTDEEMRQHEEQRLKRADNERERAENQRQQAENERQQAETKRRTAELEKQRLEELERRRDSGINSKFKRYLAVLRNYEKDHKSLLQEFASTVYIETPARLKMVQKIFALEELLRGFVTAETRDAFDTKKREISTTVEYVTGATKIYGDSMWKAFAVDGTYGNVYYENTRHGIINLIQTMWIDMQKCVFTKNHVEYANTGPIVRKTEEKKENEEKEVKSYYSWESPFEKPVDRHTDFEGRRYTVIDTFDERTGMQEYSKHEIRRYENTKASDEENTDEYEAEYEEWVDGIFLRMWTKKIKVPPATFDTMADKTYPERIKERLNSYYTTGPVSLKLAKLKRLSLM